jgi:hypothetical protein
MDQMNLREALEVACAGGSITPGAVKDNSYVHDDEEAYCAMGRTWASIPEMKAENMETWRLTDDQLEPIVIYALFQGWKPTSNFVF